MEIKEAIQILKDHNKWRRDDNVPNSCEMVDVYKLGEAIDLAVKELNKLLIARVSWRSEQLPDFDVKELSDVVKDCQESKDDLHTLICSIWNKAYQTGVYYERQIKY